MIAPIPPLPPVPAAATTPGAAPSSSANGFSGLLGSAVDSLATTQAAAANASLSLAAGTESLPNYMIEATKAEMSAELTVAVRNAAMTSLNQILSM